MLVAAFRELDAAGIALHDVALRRPTLDDVFLGAHRARPADEDTDRPTPTTAATRTPIRAEKEVAAR